MYRNNDRNKRHELRTPCTQHTDCWVRKNKVDHAAFNSALQGFNAFGDTDAFVERYHSELTLEYKNINSNDKLSRGQEIAFKKRVDRIDPWNHAVFILYLDNHEQQRVPTIHRITIYDYRFRLQGVPIDRRFHNETDGMIYLKEQISLWEARSEQVEALVNEHSAELSKIIHWR